ncbi:DNA polymerase delta subunit 3 [Topomyia yanbarensis]|uniref:DNA polymerase delta subunit 3 n=1 Tax=Topomyia yanbarensis TaxID=2498891 RepID=UPI00273CA331|nr:DNA polymerase delta subunit 3 [Topomyia yanbarensis]
MKSAMEKSCMEEISHTVLDSLQKISVRTISNSYGLNIAEAVAILQKWIDENAAKAKLAPEFIVRGINPQRGSAFVTVASDKKLKTIQSKAKQVSSLLYSVEVASVSSRKITIPEDQEFKVINLPLEAGKRDIKVFVPADLPPAAVKPEPKSKINSMFAAGSSKPVSKPEPPKPAIKEEKQSSPPLTIKQEPAKPSSPKKSPAKGSPSKKKESKKPVTGKASIASFFSNKPATTKAAVSTPVVTVKEEKVSPKEETAQDKQLNGKQQDESQRWKRMISDESDDDDVVPNTPQEKKETKKAGGRKKSMTTKKEAANKKNVNPSKKSRILQIEDSSEDDEGDEDKSFKEPEEREIQFEAEGPQDVEMKDSEERDESPTKSADNDSSSLQRKKAKVKKLVTKTFQDDAGYLITVKEYEMVSASEDEVDDVSNNNTTEGKDIAKQSPPDGGKENKSVKAADKKVSKATPPTPKTKQGSIKSFFSKK